MVKWEYAEILWNSGGVNSEYITIYLVKNGKKKEIERFKGDKILEALNFMGEYGWELVTDYGNSSYLKRKKN